MERERERRETRRPRPSSSSPPARRGAPSAEGAPAPGPRGARPPSRPRPSGGARARASPDGRCPRREEASHGQQAEDAPRLSRAGSVARDVRSRRSVSTRGLRRVVPPSCSAGRRPADVGRQATPGLAEPGVLRSRTAPRQGCVLRSRTRHPVRGAASQPAGYARRGRLRFLAMRGARLPASCPRDAGDVMRRRPCVSGTCSSAPSADSRAPLAVYVRSANPLHGGRSCASRCTRSWSSSRWWRRPCLSPPYLVSARSHSLVGQM